MARMPAVSPLPATPMPPSVETLLSWLVPWSMQAEPVDAGDSRRVIAGEDLHLIQLLGRKLETEADGMSQLPEIIVADRAVDPQRGGDWRCSDC